MATIRKRGKNSWQIRVSCGYSTSGAHMEQTMTWKAADGMTERQIEKELDCQAVMFEENCMKGQVTSAVKFENFSRRWFCEYAELKLKPKTIEDYHWLEKRIYKSIGHLRLDRITPRHIQKLILDMSAENECAARYNRNGKLSAKTIKLHILLISTIFDYAIKMQLLQNKPCRAVTLPKPDTQKRSIYSLEEAQQMLFLFQNEPEDNYKYVAFYTLVLYTKFRLGEILGLEWSDIDLKSNLIVVNCISLYSKSQGGIAVCCNSQFPPFFGFGFNLERFKC
ncbi:MAG: site-specific integrase [Oscillospiraceae bacterium]|nr:site-specific integrase [Oscillospiraceae bacterium]